MDEEQLRQLIRKIIKEETDPNRIRIGVSNRHIHLTDEDFATLFPGQEMTVYKPLYQHEEFASNQFADIVGPQGTIKHVRILGPKRAHSQVEIARSETFELGIDAPIRLSGHLEGAPSVKLVTKDGEVEVQGVIVAKRHIHMSLEDAARFGVKLGDTVSVEINSDERRTIFDDVICRPRKDFLLEMHIDTDEANAANVNANTFGRIIKK
ncbi:phosphate propanoyltransferase [Pediococcus acidilactici]|uniref:phosphate propanoyltransferase n=1 Tax=Pediococcus acidilactici TaxID=1254 RepID=UPI00132912E2|nr:phosphate propanoyltransferase [Pediococcus acidilactici]KAF0386583.1 phosphate propanoyltransferase [Pediococcus acidilactici]KAF0427566.1 phosphate propanoyltransferase [Pediococcus acidilactici]KAF0442941.1 phosphate propanoyltransferase [Pediococcus acidilactici]KAF0552688.1 phosphate propanoyltransferase [Pediococcus acidilactici]MCT3041227.1 phosphate propanoyltransferase [Pediococcus acidilactici]